MYFVKVGILVMSLVVTQTGPQQTFAHVKPAMVQPIGNKGSAGSVHSYNNQSFVLH
jgi:hypothetical protein